MNTIPETMTQGGAHYLRQKIQSYWKARGKNPVLTVEEVHLAAAPSDADRSYYVVRSNMIGGYPT